MKILNLIMLGLYLSIFSFQVEANVKYRHMISWSEEPASVYQIEISHEEKDNVIIRQIVNEASYNLIVEEPGIYFWRYRAKGKTKWGPFSGHTAVRFKLPEPAEKNVILMKSPENGKVVNYKNDRVEIEFKWDEPDPEASYHLELYLKKSKTPSRVMTVRGGSHVVKMKKIPEYLSWRVFQKKTGQAPSGNKETFEIKLRPALDEFKQSEDFLLSLALFQAQSKFTFDSTAFKSDETFSGQIAEFNAEYFPKFWNRRRSLNLYIRSATFENESQSLGNKKVGLEFGMAFGEEPSTLHQIYLGYQFLNNFEMDFGSALNTDYDQNFVTGRYLFRKQFAERWAFEMNASLQLGSFSAGPSYVLRPGINFLLTRELWINAYAIQEKYLSEIDNSSRSDKVKIEQTNSGIGVGLTWMPGKL